ncbi:MAG TPA: shikimate dehydrogenase [Egibacteraceae bacterium]|nr:shikimate dehydrogenase [Egibacteraceae bacterium]
MRRVRLFGHPVAHSVSPAIHNAAFAALGIEAVYEALDVAPEALPAAVAELRATPLLGANCTIPHKLAVLDLVDERTEETRLIGAANTLFWRDGALAADNTDARGLEQAIRAVWTPEPGGKAVLLGSGGAARAAAVALARLGLAVAVVARRPVPAESVAATAAEAGAEGVGLPLEHARAALDDAVLVVNATPLGLHGEPLPEPFMRLRPEQFALDLVYGGGDTPFLAAARAAGCPTEDGLGMLVGQAALSFERWTGRQAPLDVMRQAAEAALGR